MKTTIEIQNLKCGGCAHTVTQAVSKVEGINDVNVDVENSTVTFSYEKEVQLDAVTKKLLSIGYPVAGEENSLGSKAKSYVSCAIGKMNK
ncbi:MAG: heavy-metal-associated domain-containing protein [Flavobacteriales bacterium]|nr:heavy-metal-associated domain-containing protein [Flavobacteriales bacterium]